VSRRGRLRILRGAADEVLACLKNDSLTDPERKREIEKLINEVFSTLFNSDETRTCSSTRTLFSRFLA